MEGSSHILREVARARQEELMRAPERARLAGARNSDDRSRGGKGTALPEVLLAGIGIYQLVLGTLMIGAPGAFFDWIGTYGTQNDHYTRDAGA